MGRELRELYGRFIDAAHQARNAGGVTEGTGKLVEMSQLLGELEFTAPGQVSIAAFEWFKSIAEFRAALITDQDTSDEAELVHRRRREFINATRASLDLPVLREP